MILVKCGRKCGSSGVVCDFLVGRALFRFFLGSSGCFSDFWPFRPFSGCFGPFLAVLMVSDSSGPFLTGSVIFWPRSVPFCPFWWFPGVCAVQNSIQLVFSHNCFRTIRIHLPWGTGHKHASRRVFIFIGLGGACCLRVVTSCLIWKSLPEGVTNPCQLTNYGHTMQVRYLGRYPLTGTVQWVQRHGLTRNF